MLDQVWWTLDGWISVGPGPFPNGQNYIGVMFGQFPTWDQVKKKVQKKKKEKKNTS